MSGAQLTWQQEKALRDRPEAVEVRMHRRKQRGEPLSCFGLNFDPLLERQRLVAYWRAQREHWPSPMPNNWALYFNPTFRRLLMPGLRARLDARTAQHRAQFAAELRRSAQEWEQKKALKAAATKAKKAGQSLLFSAEEAA